MKFKDLQAKYDEQALRRKIKIRLETNKFKRFWKWVWYYIAFPWVWLFYNITDWRTAICVLISAALWSSSVWAFYLAAVLTGLTTDVAKWLWGVGSAVWVWWLSPAGSPFILLVTLTSTGIKALWNKIRHRKKDRNNEQ